MRLMAGALPEPPHLPQDGPEVMPEPPHARQGWEMLNMPRPIFACPEPPQAGQGPGAEPGAEPEPPQLPHASNP